MSLNHIRMYLQLRAGLVSAVNILSSQRTKYHSAMCVCTNVEVGSAEVNDLRPCCLHQFLDLDPNEVDIPVLVYQCSWPGLHVQVDPPFHVSQ